MLHAGLATATKNEIWALDDDSASTLAKSVANVARHYDLEATEKATDWANLIIAAGAVYGSRIYATAAKRHADAAKAQEEAASNTVYQFPGGLQQ